MTKKKKYTPAAFDEFYLNLSPGEEKLYEIILGKRSEVIELIVNYELNGIITQFREFWTEEGKRIGKIRL